MMKFQKAMITRKMTKRETLKAANKLILIKMKQHEKNRSIMQLKDLVGMKSKSTQKEYLQQLERDYYMELKQKVNDFVNAGCKLRYEQLFELEQENEADRTFEETKEIEKRRSLERFCNEG